ncbi:Hypothetical protein P9211_06441 [Prochlorococcus marinus str. MIT 9211]|uniref:Uncharacterized protein n=1 Tax=Prochlorococcus marinus (strain MIT 9211) TaxID=93059 RepID=A9B9R3_PROM4|nr:Hypothetical protein P9211_06441 [Prochlorococcus marinus str. MIT 9211]
MIGKFVSSQDYQCQALANFMNLLATITAGGFNPTAAAVGVASIALFAIVGFIAGPNLEKFDVDGKS